MEYVREISFEYWDHKTGIFYHMVLPGNKKNIEGLKKLPSVRNIRFTYRRFTVAS